MAMAPSPDDVVPETLVQQNWVDCVEKFKESSHEGSLKSCLAQFHLTGSGDASGSGGEPSASVTKNVLSLSSNNNNPPTLWVIGV